MKDNLVAGKLPDSFTTNKDKWTDLIGEEVGRIILHNGVSTVPPPRANSEKSVFHKDYPGAKPMGRPLADEMYVTDQGVVVRIGTYRKMVTWANIYEADFLAEAL